MKWFSILCLSLLAPSPFLVSAPPPEVDLFFRNPEFRDPSLSPDGKTLAILAPIGGIMNLVAMDLETRQLKALSGEPRDVTWFYWVSDDRLFYGVDSGEVTNEAQRVGGAIVGVNRDGSDLKMVVEPWRERNQGAAGSSLRPGSRVNGEINVIHPLPDDPDWVLVTNNARRSREPDVFKMNVHNGRLQRLFNNPGEIIGYYVDGKGEVRAGIGIDLKASGATTLWIRDIDTGEWRLTASYESMETDMDIVGIDPGSDRALVWSNRQSDRKALYWLSLSTGEMEAEPVLEDPVYDIDVGTNRGRNQVIRGFKTDRVVGVYYERDKPAEHFFNDQYAKLQAIIDSALPDTVNRMAGADRKATRLLIRSFSDVKTPEYFLLDLKSMAMEPVAKSYPWLDQVQLAKQRPITYEARDGRTIHGYLTLPVDYREGARVPLVLLPHGGPWARDTWGSTNWIDLQGQFLASRGFAVMLINFRGSTGYGDDHYKASFKKIDDMHNDVIDAARWAIAEGYADPDMLGIMGASWGGYATMTAVTKEPDMFKFAVNIFGVMDIPVHMQRYLKWDREVAYDAWVERIGDPEVAEERALLDAYSPINHIDKLKVPVFIYHGLWDFNVHYEQSDMLESALRREGFREPRDYIYLKAKNETHSAYNEETRLELHRAIDEFLKPFAPAWKN